MPPTLESSQTLASLVSSCAVPPLGWSAGSSGSVKAHPVRRRVEWLQGCRRVTDTLPNSHGYLDGVAPKGRLLSSTKRGLSTSMIVAGRVSVPITDVDAADYDADDDDDDSQ